jgi:hypothetical protein
MRTLRLFILMVVALGLAWWLVQLFAHNKHKAAPPAPVPVAALTAPAPTVAPRAATPAMPAPVAPVQPPTPSPYATLRVRFVAPTPALLHGRVRVNAHDALGVYPAQSHTAALDAGDSVAFSNIAPCDCTVEAALNGYMLIETNLSLAMYADCECLLTFTLAPAWTLRGILKDKTTGEPVSDANIELLMNSGMSASRTVRSDAAGMFGCADLAEARVRLTIAHTNYPTHFAQVMCMTPDTDPLVIYLCKGATVFGHVLDERGAPVPARAVYCDTSRTSTDADGAFRLDNIIPQETFTRVVADESWIKGYADLVLAPGDTREISLFVQTVITTPPVLKVVATYTNGAPVPRLEMAIRQTLRQGGAITFTGGRIASRGSADGVYYEECGGAEGTYTVVASAERCASLCFNDVQMVNNHTTELVAVFGPASAELCGVAERASGAPASGITLFARAVALDAEFSTHCDVDGNFVFASILPDQCYTLSAHDAEITQPRVPVMPGTSVCVVLAPYSMITFDTALSNTHEAILMTSYELVRTPVANPTFHSNIGSDLKKSLTQAWAGESYLYLRAAGCKTRELHLTLRPDEDVDLGTIWFEKDSATP